MNKKSSIIILVLMIFTMGCIGEITQPNETIPPETTLPPITRLPSTTPAQTTQPPEKVGSIEYSNTNSLVDPAWIEEHIDDPNIKLIDLSVSKSQYDEGHIKGSVFVDWKTDIIDPEEDERYNIAPKEIIETLLGDKGVKEDTTIVLYDNLDNRLSTRMFWTLRYYGHKDVRILNGGRKIWESSGKSYTAEVPEIAKTTYTISSININYLTDIDYIKMNLDNPEVLLIDGRPTGMYTGEKAGAVFHTKKEHARRGHIPGAINIPWKENLNEDGRFKSAEELKKLYEATGVTKDKIITTYCNEGLHASPPWFVLNELLGYPDVRLYDNSMSEWANNPDVPIKMGSEP